MLALVSGLSAVHEEMIRLMVESEMLCVESRKLLATSHNLIAQSRRLLNPAWEVSGASDGEVHPPTNGNGGYLPPYELGCLVRDKLKSGKLFILPNAKCWAGPATGRVACAVCDEIIFGGVECEVGEPHSAVFSHLLCHSIWCQESRNLREQDSTATP